jgi:GT2 family glycosyltransferase
MDEQANGSERGVTVVIPVKGRVRELRAALKSLSAAAGRCADPVEVIVVDDSDPADAQRHREHCRDHGAHYERGPRHVGAKRNLGVHLASYDLVYFTDSDCRPEPETIDRLVQRLRAAPRNVAGVAGPTLVEQDPGALHRIMRGSALLNGDLENPLRNTTLTWATTSNFMVRRSAFRSIGGFVEESLTVVAGEDVDLGIRLTQRGFLIVCEPDAMVTHDHKSTSSLSWVIPRLFNYGRSEQWLASRYPGFRRLRWNPASVILLTAVGAAVWAPRTHGRSLLWIPLVAGASLGVDTYRGSRRDAGSSAHPARQAVRAMVEWSFDVGALTAAFQLRRPDLMLSGFHLPDNAQNDGGGRAE